MPASPCVAAATPAWQPNGDLERGFARIRCDHCQKDHLLAFSCILLRPPGYGGTRGPLVASTPHRTRRALVRGPSCHQKKVQLFGALLTDTILFPVPHPPSRFACYGETGRHVTLTIPKMLRPYFRYHRNLLKDLCRIAHECIRDVMRISLDQPEGMPGIVMAIHTFGEYLDFHPHPPSRFACFGGTGLHLLMADGLFLRAEEVEDGEEVEEGVEVIDVSEHQPRRIPSKKWRDLIKKVWEADPMVCPTCQREMRIVSLIDDRDVIEKILKCLGLWQQGVRVDPQRQSGADPPGGDWVYEPVEQDPFPACHAEAERRRDYDSEPVLFYANA